MTVGATPPLLPLARVPAVELPALHYPAADLLDFAAAELANALQLRTGALPVIQRAASGQPGAIAVAIDTTVERGSFRIAGGESGATILGGAPLDAAHGVAYLTQLMLAGASQAELATPGRTVAPAFEDRFVDLGGVGILADTAAWLARDYSHHTRKFLHVLSAEPPFVDAQGFEEARAQFRAFVLRMAAYGYDGIVFKGFLEFVDFDALDDGFSVYAADSPYRARHGALRAAFGEMFAYAQSLGMKVVLSTDMVALTPPLEAYLLRRFGRVDAEDAALWDVYSVAAREVFDALPVDGIMIRVGETGSVFNVEGWDYRSELLVRTRPALQTMLRAFTSAAAERQRTIYFRTWSVGIGETGGMHTRPDVYARIFDELDVPNLVVSTKYTAGDFYSWLPLNPTLAVGDERRMVELQARREYDGFGAFPNFMAPLHQSALRELRASNPRIRDIWVWTQEGGPPRVSPQSLYPFHGFWQLIDADVWVAARLAWDLDADVQALARAWARRTVGGDSAAVATLTDVLLTSRAAVQDGLYIEHYARRQVRALGLEPPPMLWIFEWDIVTGSSAALSTIYLLGRDDLDAAIRRGRSAVLEVRRLRERVDAIDVARVTQPEFIASLRRSLAYQEDLLGTLAAYREAFLSHYRWLDTGNSDARAAWRSAAATYEARRTAHVERYGADLDFRAYSFFDADTGLAHARRASIMAWAARLLIGCVVLALVATALHSARVRGAAMPVIGVAVTLVLATSLVFSSLLSVAVPVLVATVMSAFLAGLLLPGRTTAPVRPAAAAALLALALVPLVPVAVRGPGYFWLQFWTSDVFRTTLVIVAGGIAGAGAYLLFAALRASLASARAAAGRILLATGAPMVAVGTLIAAVGLERALTMINNDLAVLPMGLSAILGITTHLGIPLALPLWLVAAGAALMASGLALDHLGRGRIRRPAADAPCGHAPQVAR